MSANTESPSFSQRLHNFEVAHDNAVWKLMNEASVEVIKDHGVTEDIGMIALAMHGVQYRDSSPIRMMGDFEHGPIHEMYREFEEEARRYVDLGLAMKYLAGPRFAYIPPIYSEEYSTYGSMGLHGVIERGIGDNSNRVYFGKLVLPALITKTHEPTKVKAGHIDIAKFARDKTERTAKEVYLPYEHMQHRNEWIKGRTAIMAAGLSGFGRTHAEDRAFIDAYYQAEEALLTAAETMKKDDWLKALRPSRRDTLIED